MEEWKYYLVQGYYGEFIVRALGTYYCEKFTGNLKWEKAQNLVDILQRDTREYKEIAEDEARTFVEGVVEKVTARGK